MEFCQHISKLEGVGGGPWWRGAGLNRLTEVFPGPSNIFAVIYGLMNSERQKIRVLFTEVRFKSL